MHPADNRILHHVAEQGPITHRQLAKDLGWSYEEEEDAWDFLMGLVKEGLVEGRFHPGDKGPVWKWSIE
jgi:molybdenum-dependent DNA-binding transcriptional regulator ModE